MKVLNLLWCYALTAVWAACLVSEVIDLASGTDWWARHLGIAALFAAVLPLGVRDTWRAHRALAAKKDSGEQPETGGAS